MKEVGSGLAEAQVPRLWIWPISCRKSKDVGPRMQEDNCKWLEHPRILLSEENPGTNPSQILRGDYTQHFIWKELIIISLSLRGVLRALHKSRHRKESSKKQKVLGDE